MDDIFDAGLQPAGFAKTVKFFHEKVKANVRDRGAEGITPREKLYAASILANYAQVSCGDHLELSPSLIEVFDNYVVPGFTTNPEVERPEMTDPTILEAGGAQVLFFTGFFQDQLRRRHDIDWYIGLGRSFYSRVGLMSRDPDRQQFFHNVYKHFGMWVEVYCDLSRTFRYSWVPIVGETSSEPES